MWIKPRQAYKRPLTVEILLEASHITFCATCLFLLEILFIHSFKRERERECTGEEEADAPLSREPYTGLDPRTQTS